MNAEQLGVPARQFLVHENEVPGRQNCMIFTGTRKNDDTRHEEIVAGVRLCYQAGNRSFKLSYYLPAGRSMCLRG